MGIRGVLYESIASGAYMLQLKKKPVVSHVYSAEDLHGYTGVVWTMEAQRTLYYDTIRVWMQIYESEKGLKRSRMALHAIATRFLVNVPCLDKIARMRSAELTERYVLSTHRVFTESLRDNRSDQGVIARECVENPYPRGTVQRATWVELQRCITSILLNQQQNVRWLGWLIHHLPALSPTV